MTVTLEQLEFVRRVLAQARDPSVPLLERLRFVGITGAILDEFFEVRVARLKMAGEHTALEPIGARVREIVREQRGLLQEELMPALDDAGIRIAADCPGFFLRELQPVLTPVGLDPADPFPAVANKSLHFLVALEGEDAFRRDARYALVPAPRFLPELVRTDDGAFAPVARIVRDNVGAFFPGMRVRGCWPFRVTRNSELWVDEEEIEDQLLALKGELQRRQYGAAVRLEVEDSPPEVNRYLLEQLGLGTADLYQIAFDGLASLHDLAERPDLRYEPFQPRVPFETDGMFARIRAGDVVLHHPYESFAPVLELLRQAARDPDVLAIKITLYRIGAPSPMTDALLHAAHAGKEVTAVVELRARFDEEANLDVAGRLQAAGANVVYGISGFKAHAKTMLIVRREGERLRRYVHLSTGNYHLENTRTYTDLSLLTCDDDLGADVADVFLELTGRGEAATLRKLVQAPFALHDKILALIEQEAAAAEAGRPAFLRARMNALTEPGIIAALERAAGAGVEIDLIVRGPCLVRPRRNLRVRSVVGRFLEHSRVFHFHAGGEEITYCSSADWMARNFFRRVELAFPVADPRVRDEALTLYLADNTQAWELDADGSYHRVEPDGDERVSAQEALLG